MSFIGELLPSSMRKSLVDLVKALGKRGLAYMVVGAVPVQFYGRERFSRDVDVVVFLNNRNVAGFFQLMKGGRYEIVYPLPHEHKLDRPEDLLGWRLVKLKDSRYEALLDVHLKPEELGLDEGSLVRVRTVAMDGKEVAIPSPEDYLVTKLISRRPSSHDFEDIMSVLLNQHEAIDWEYLEHRARKCGVLFLLKYFRDAIEKKLGRKKG